jgi:parallel beta-helix repeat protein
MKIKSFAAFALFSISSMASTIHIPRDYPTIQEGLYAALQGDKILIAPGIYDESLRWPETDSIVLQGETSGDAVEIHALSSQRALTKDSMTSVSMALRSLKFRLGESLDRGGGIYIENAIVEISGCTISNNHSRYEGGGGYFDRCELVIEGCVIEHNRTGEDPYPNGDGLGLYLNNCTGTVTGSFIRDHSGYYFNGAGIYSNGAVQFLQNTFERNRQLGSDYEGGALYVSGDNVRIEGNIFRENRNQGAAIFINADNFRIINNLIESHPDYFAVESSGTGEICFCSFVSNAQGGIHVSGSMSQIYVHNCILTGGGEGIALDEGTAYSDYNCFWDNQTDLDGCDPGMSDLFADPLFASSEDRLYLLSQKSSGQEADSPCFDSGEVGEPIPYGTTRTDRQLD